MNNEKILKMAETYAAEAGVPYEEVGKHIGKVVGGAITECFSGQRGSGETVEGIKRLATAFSLSTGIPVERTAEAMGRELGSIVSCAMTTQPQVSYLEVASS